MAEFFRGSYNNHIQNSTFNVHTTTHNHHPTEESQGFKILKKAVAPNAFHDSDDRFDPPKCHENTRVAIVNKIIQWVKGETETDSFVLWMSGPAGAGKTAIARKIAEICEAHGLLLASFLFFRPDSRRNTIKPLVANIAYCASRVVPGVRPAIEAIIDTDPHIFSSSLETQLRKLVFEPLRLLYERGQFPPPLIVIDGLDECLDQDSQDNVIQVLSSSMPKYQLPLKFLIVSRPETHIKFSIKVSGQKTRISHLELNDDFCPDDDIRLFLTEKFEEIRTCHPLAPRNSSVWPSEEQMDTLVCKASGQFIYASLLVRFVNFARDSPTRSLDIVLELRPPVHRDLPFAELDALYAFILSGAGPGIDQILKILGVHIALGVDRDRLGKNNIREIRVIEAVLGLEPGDVRVALIGLSSLLDVRYSRLLHGDYQIVFHHSSLQDFLFNRLRAKDYYIDIQPMHQAVAQWPLRTFTLENLSQPAQHIAGCIELAGHLKQLSHSQLIELRRDLEDFSFGPYLENSIEIVAHKIRMNPTSIGEMVQACACMFFDGLQELKQAELHQHHSEQYLSFVVSQIDGRRCPEAFHLMSAVWFVLQRPLNSCAEEPIRQMFRPHSVDPSAVWRNLCGRLFAFDAWDVSWDVRNHQFLRYPDSKYKDMRAKAGPLAKLYGAAAEMNSEVSLPSRLSRIVIACLDFLHLHGSYKTCRPDQHLRSWAAKSKRIPWLWRRRTLVGSVRRKYKPTRAQSRWRWICSLLPTIRQPRQTLLMLEERTMYIWTLDLLRRTLRKARGSEELVETLTKRLMLWPAPILFPRRFKRIRKAVEAYLEQVGPSSSSAEESEVCALGDVLEEIEYSSCECSDEEYFTCSEGP